MNFLQRRRTEAPELDPAGIYEEARDTASSLYQSSLVDRVPQVTDLEGRNNSLYGIERPLSMPGMLSLEGSAFMPTKHESSNMFMRTTGKLAMIHIQEGAEGLTGQTTESTDLAVVNLRAAQGRIYYGFAKQLYENAGIPWEFDNSERMIVLFRYSPKTNEYHYLANVSDRHPVNEIPFIVKPSPDENSKLTYAFGLPWSPVIEDEIRFQTQGLRREYAEDGTYEDIAVPLQRRMTPESLVTALEITQELIMNKVSDVDLLPPNVKSRFSYQDRQNLDFIPRQSLASFTYRMGLYYSRLIAQEKKRGINRGGNDDITGALFENGRPSKKTINTIGEKLIMAACHETALRRLEDRMSMGEGVFGGIGVVDVNDLSMHGIVKQLAEASGIDINDPDQRKLLQGTVYIKHNGNLPGPFTHERIGGNRQDVKGIIPLFNAASAYAPYKGFHFLHNAVEEIASSTPDGDPMMPGLLSLISVPRSVTAAGMSHEVIAAVDLMEAPAYFMEWYLFHKENGSDRMRPYYHPDFISEHNITMRSILNGDFINAAKGTPADRLSRAGHGLLRLSGNTRDSQGISRDLVPEQLLDIQGAIQVKKQIATTDPKSKALVPLEESRPLEIVSGKATPIIDRKLPAVRKKNRGKITQKTMSSKKYEVERSKGNTPILKSSLIAEPGELEIVSMVSDGNVHLKAFTPKQYEEMKESDPETPTLPVAEVRVMGGGTKEA